MQPVRVMRRDNGSEGFMVQVVVTSNEPLAVVVMDDGAIIASGLQNFVALAPAHTALSRV